MYFLMLFVLHVFWYFQISIKPTKVRNLLISPYRFESQV